MKRQIEYYKDKQTTNMSKTRMKLRKIFRVVITFSVAILFVGLALLTTLRWSFNLNTMYRVLDASNYYSNLLQEINSDAKIITIPTGLPMEVLEGIFQLTEIRDDVNLHLEKTFKGEAGKPDLGIIKNRLRKNVDRYLNEKEVIPDKALSQSINHYINSVANEYGNRMKIPLLDFCIRLIIDNQKLYLLAGVILISVTLIAIFVLYKLNSSPRGFLFCIYNSTLATALILVAFSKLLIKDKLNTGLQIASNSLGEFIIDYFTIYFRNILGISVIFLILSFALLIAERAARYKSL